MINKILSIMTSSLILAVMLFMPIKSTAVDSVISPTISGDSYIYEIESGDINGDAFLSSDLSGFSGAGYINIAGGSVKLNISVPKAGAYHVYISASTENNTNNKCEKVQINDGTVYYVLIQASDFATWAQYEPGIDTYTNNILSVVPPDQGFTFNSGSNSVTISANYGYAYYDRIILTPIDSANQTEKVIKPDLIEGAYSFEVEKGQVSNGALIENSVSGYSGEGYVDIMAGNIKMEIDVPYSGNYEFYIVGSSNNNTDDKCDFVSVNHGPNNYTNSLASQFGAWNWCTPGTDYYWKDNALIAVAPEEGFYFNAGSNILDFTVNWGYALYDRIIIKPISIIIPPNDMAANVIEKINSLPEKVKKEDRKAIIEVKNAFDTLSGIQKIAVTNYEKLDRALDALAEISTIQDPVKQGNVLVYEAEECMFLGNNSYVDNKIGGYSGNGYAFVMTDGFEMKINVPVTGKYRVLIASANDANGARCDYFSVNNGQKYCIAIPGNTERTWSLCEPGIENWDNGELKPIPDKEGYSFTSGINTIRLDVNWGYAAYDRIVLVPVDNSTVVDGNTVQKLNRRRTPAA